MDPEGLAELVSQHEKGIITWEYVSIVGSIPNDFQISNDERVIVAYIERCCGKKTRRLFPFLIAALRERDHYGTWSWDWDAKTEFRRGYAEVYVGAPLWRYDAWIDWSAPSW